MAEENLVTINEMAKRLNCSRDTICRMIHKKVIPVAKLPGSYRMNPEKVILALSRDEDRRQS